MARAVILLMSGLLAGCTAPFDSQLPNTIRLLPVQPGAPVLTAEDLYGRVLVLSFFNPECFLCHHALAQVDSVYRQFGYREDVKVLLIHGDAVHGPSWDPRRPMNTYLGTYGIEAPAYWDHRGHLSLRFDQRLRHRRYDPRIDPRRPRTRRYIPPVYTVVLDREGRIVKRQDGSAISVDRLLTAVTTALNCKPQQSAQQP